MLNSGNQDHLPFGEASELRRGPADRRARKGDATRREFQRVDRERRRIAGLYKALSQANQAIVHATNGRWQIGTAPAGGASISITWPRALSSHHEVSPR